MVTKRPVAVFSLMFFCSVEFFSANTVFVPSRKKPLKLCPVQCDRRGGYRATLSCVGDRGEDSGMVVLGVCGVLGCRTACWRVGPVQGWRAVQWESACRRAARWTLIARGFHPTLGLFSLRWVVSLTC